jgi:plastocyanin
MTKKNAQIAGVVMPVMIAMLLLFAGSSPVTATDQASAANVAVKIDNFVFGPQVITVPVGTTVTWTNSDDIPHTAVSTDGVFKSKVMDTDEKFSYTFTRAGTYSYYCSVHPKMTGQVVVSEARKWHGNGYGFPFPCSNDVCNGSVLLQLSVASGCAGTISQSSRRKDSLHFAARPLSEPFYLSPFLPPSA